MTPAVTLERLGLDPQTKNAVWVTWCPAPLLEAVGRLALAGAMCPECGGPINLLRPGGVVLHVADTPNCISISDRCPAKACQAQLHWDATPAERRADLRWPKVAVMAEG